MSKLSPPDVTVVTPSYQQASFIEETIQSVPAQTGVRVEYLVMDGGSTDGTLEILEKYRSQLQYLSERDQGQTDAINKGISTRSGKDSGLSELRRHLPARRPDQGGPFPG